MPLQCRQFVCAALDTLGPESDITAMRRLMLLRHAKTERAAPGERDRDRRLMKRGRAEAPVIGAYMVHHDLIPDLALVSPAKRAQETWALAATAFSKAPRTANDERIYNATAEALIGVIGEARKAHTLVVVGHNPGLHDLAVQLIGSGDVDMREQLNEKLPTSGLVVIDLPVDDWSLLHPRAGRLGALCESTADRRGHRIRLKGWLHSAIAAAAFRGLFERPAGPDSTASAAVSPASCGTVIMPILPARIFAALALGQPSAAMPVARPQTKGSLSDAGTDGEPLPRLPLAYHLLLPVVIFAVSTLTIAISRRSNLVSTLWAANAIMVAMLLCRGRSFTDYASIIIGGSAATALASLLTGNDPALSATLMAANAIEVVGASALLSAFQINSSNLTSFNGVLTFIFVVGGVAPIGSTLISASAYGLAHNVPWSAVWRNWYSGHALGMVILVPFLVSIMSKEWRALRIKERLSEAAAILAFFIAVSICAVYFRPVIFIIAPAILLATVRFGVIGATAATFLVAVIASIFVVMDIGHPLFLSQPDLSQRIFALQAFLAITSLWSLPTAALLTERDRLLSDLSRANSQLAADSERTSHLVVGLRRHLSMAEENERLRLSHELHDQAGQSLIAAILELNEIDALTSGAARERLHLVRKRMEEMGKTLHRIAWELRPPSIDEARLAQGARELHRRMGRAMRHRGRLPLRRSEPR